MTDMNRSALKDVVLIFERGAERDEALVAILGKSLAEDGRKVYVDNHRRISVDWARSVEERIRRADAVIAIITNSALESDMFGYELDVVSDAKLKNRSMRLICVPIGEDAVALGGTGPLTGGYQTSAWDGNSDSATVIAEILDLLDSPVREGVTGVLLGSAGGGVSCDSPYYIQRDADRELEAYLDAAEATTLIKGPRQSGKTSLIAQGIKLVRNSGARAIITDFQRLGSNLAASESDFYQVLASSLARQMSTNYDIDWDWSWDDLFGPTSNLDDFVRSMASTDNRRLVWFMDEADWLFSTSFADSFFALVRSWHNARALSSEPPWTKFSVVIAYATEAHLFIQDINQSPFNVGQRIELSGFSLRQTEELNVRYGEPLRGIDQVYAVQEVLDGQPYLTRLAFDTLLRTGGNLKALLAAADSDNGPFTDHLRRVLVSVTQLGTVREVVDQVLANKFVASSPDVERLVTAGILSKDSSGNHRFRCRLYRKYLERHLK